MFGVDLLPSLGTETGMLLLWGIGHCDTLDGPLVKLAEKSLEDKNVNLVLPWVRPEDESEIRRGFDQAQAFATSVRKPGRWPIGISWRRSYASIEPEKARRLPG